MLRLPISGLTPRIDLRDLAYLKKTVDLAAKPLLASFTTSRISREKWRPRDQNTRDYCKFGAQVSAGYSAAAESAPRLARCFRAWHGGGLEISLAFLWNSKCRAKRIQSWGIWWRKLLKAKVFSAKYGYSDIIYAIFIICDSLCEQQSKQFVALESGGNFAPVLAISSKGLNPGTGTFRIFSWSSGWG